MPAQYGGARGATLSRDLSAFTRVCNAQERANSVVPFFDSETFRPRAEFLSDTRTKFATSCIEHNIATSWSRMRRHREALQKFLALRVLADAKRIHAKRVGDPGCHVRESHTQCELFTSCDSSIRQSVEWKASFGNSRLRKWRKGTQFASSH
jgi:hypothetical protein